jgi:FtsP/CotA-like multicopper oxidase with cupredoxin domain
MVSFLVITGFHDSSGVFKQNATAPYVFGDNVFVSIPAKTDPSQEPSSLVYKVDTEGSHMPGLHWYHPHKHGGTFIQTLGANGLLYVPDPSVSWLPSENGCGEITSVLKNSTQIFMTITTLPFLPPPPSMDDVNKLENADLALMSNESNPVSPLCCSEPGSNDPAYTATGMKNNTILINGIYQPQIKLTTGGYQAWKILNAGPKGWVNMVVVTREEKPAPCEILLYAKDGVFLQEVPRTVNLMILSPGNRAEMLVKCTEPGTYFLSATGDNNFLGNGPPVFALLNGQVTQDVVAEIIVTDAATESLASTPAFADSIPEEGCVPLRASYAPDLRDENILRHNATDKVIQTDMGITPPLAPQNWSCSFNNRFFEYPTENPWVMRLGSIVEASTMTGLVEHPMHIHINPMMIAYLNNTAMQATKYTFDPWMKVGDYHDTLLMPMYPGFGAGWKLRWQPGAITGYSVAHW